MMLKCLRLAVVLILFYSLNGCGGGSPTGSEMTGSYCANVKGLSICTVSVNPYYGGTTDTPNYTANVDVYPISDCDPTQEGPQPEPFMDHGAVVNFTIRALNPYADSPPNTRIVLERYVIDYRIATDSITAPPIEQYEGYMSITIPSPLSSATSMSISTSITFVDLPRKFKYYDVLERGLYSSRGSLINNYVATVTFYGRTDTGDRFSIVGNVSFSMGAYDYCKLSS
ncbi:MAG: hypothetical protein N3A62_01855 [Thermodesulfovibrionales bacterium]|nr:hypothetical protein [Thermodesulfovibrionales bacterium]